LVLQRRRQTGLFWLPASVAWIAVGVGASILTAMYAFTLGSYPPALAAFDEQPGIFATLRGGVRGLFHIGMAAMFFGLVGAFLGETSASDSVLPRWVAFVGATVTLLATIRWIAMFAGIIGGLSPPLGLAAFLTDWSFWAVDLERGSPGQVAELTYPMSCIPQSGGSVVTMQSNTLQPTAGDRCEVEVVRACARRG
jgi:hypothetical protein